MLDRPSHAAAHTSAGSAYNHTSLSVPSSPEAKAASLGYERMPVLSVPGRTSVSPDSPAGASGGSGKFPPVLISFAQASGVEYCAFLP